MSEDRDDAMLRALFAEGERPPMADERFVAKVMGRVQEERARVQEWVNWGVWAGAAAAGLMFVAKGPAIVAELSRVVMASGLEAPALSGGMGLLVLAGLASAGAWLFSERA